MDTKRNFGKVPRRRTADYLDGEIAMAEEMIAQLHGRLQQLHEKRQQLRAAPVLSSKAKAFNAVELYLQEQGQPKKKEEIIEALVEWGVNFGTRSQKKHIEMSIDYNLMTVEEKKAKRKRALNWPPPRLKYFGELIGLAEWKEEEKS